MTISAAVASACYGLAMGGFAAFLTALLCWLLSFNQFWVPLVVWAGVAVISGVIVYFVKLRPSDMQIAGRIDGMGLEERTITMMGLEGSDSPIANLQRADAVKRISGASHGMIKSSFPIFSLGATLSAGQTVATGIGLCAAGLAGAGMILVQGLTGAGIMHGPEIVGSDKDKFVTISYVVEEGGFINSASGIGEEQVLLVGENAEPVTAEADDGWVFVRWSDGSTNPGRSDTNVTGDLIYTAVFEEIGGGAGGEGDGDKIDVDADGDYDESAPKPDESQGGGEGDGGDGGEGDGSGDKGDGNGSGQGGQEGGGNGSGQGDGAGGGWGGSSNQVIDGETEYKDVLQMYIESLMKQYESGATLTQAQMEFIEYYLGIL